MEIQDKVLEQFMDLVTEYGTTPITCRYCKKAIGESWVLYSLHLENHIDEFNKGDSDD